MAKRVNYGFEKRQRELRKQKKNAEKAERKRALSEDKSDSPGADAVEGAAERPGRD